MSRHLNVRASISAKVGHGNFRRVVKEINAKRNQLARTTRRCTALLLIFAIFILSVPSVVATELAKEATALSTNTANGTESRVSGWLNSLRHRSPNVPQQNKGMPPLPPRSPGISPPPPPSKADLEARVARLALNLDGDLNLLSGESKALMAVPIDAQGNAIHGLAATWDSLTLQAASITRQGTSRGRCWADKSHRWKSHVACQD
jgi:hypothetical protein